MIKSLISIFIFVTFSTLATAIADPLAQVDPKEVDLTKDVGPSSYYASISHPPVIEPKAGQPAIDFTLDSLDGKSISLKEISSDKPIVIISASASCPIYRNVMFQVENLRKKYADKIKVLLIYTLEAHPAIDPSPYTENALGQWTLAVNVQDRILVRQPLDYAARQQIALAMADRYQLDRSSILVDDKDNSFWQSYGKFPNSLFLIDRMRKVYFSEAWAFNSRDPETKRPAFEKALSQLLQMPRLES
jgi:hypothetical protein